MVFESILNPIFLPLFTLPSAISIAIISVLLSFIVTIVYKYTTDQKMMKELKDHMKEMQKKIKEHRSDPKKAMELQKQAMESNMKYMVHSFKPTLITFIPIIILFGYLNSVMAYYPIMPGQEFSTTAAFAKGTIGRVTLTVPQGFEMNGNATQPIKENQASWQLKAPAGTFYLKYEYNGQVQQKQVIITGQRQYAPVLEAYKNSPIVSVRLNNQAIHPFGGLSIFGWMPGWLGTYIIFSIAASMVFRKFLNVY
ncbi:MAG: EMC3/TMCO1 family protein [Candidatus Woesearchaeota archaeon]